MKHGEIGLFFNTINHMWFIFLCERNSLGKYLHSNGTWQNMASNGGLYKTKKLAVSVSKRYKVDVKYEYNRRLDFVV
jgi:hypothetical protein